MKNLLVLSLIVGTLTLSSCGGGEKTEVTTDSVSVDSVVVDSVEVDTAKVVTADTTKK